jgi:hypothetical protein
VSWGVIVSKYSQLRRASRKTATFSTCSARAAFSEVQSVCGNLMASPLVGLFQAGYAEINSQIAAPPPTPQAGRRRAASNLKEP